MKKKLMDLTFYWVLCVNFHWRHDYGVHAWRRRARAGSECLSIEYTELQN